MQYSPSNNATYDFMAFYPRIFSPATPPVTKKGIWNSTGSTSASTQSLVTFRDHANICKLDMMRKRSCHWVSSKGIHTFFGCLLPATQNSGCLSESCAGGKQCVFSFLFLDSYPLFCLMAYSPWLISYHVLSLQIQVDLLPYLWQLILNFFGLHTHSRTTRMWQTSVFSLTNIVSFLATHSSAGTWTSSIPSKRIGSKSNLGPPFSA